SKAQSKRQRRSRAGRCHDWLSHWSIILHACPGTAPDHRSRLNATAVPAGARSYRAPGRGTLQQLRRAAPSWTRTSDRAFERASRPSARKLLAPLLLLVAPAARLLFGAHREVLELENLTNLAASFTARPNPRVHLYEALGPLERFLLRVHGEDRIAGDELFRFGEGPVHDAALLAFVEDAYAFRARLQAIAAEKHTRLGGFLEESSHRGQVPLLGHFAGLGVLIRHDEAHEAHLLVAACRLERRRLLEFRLLVTPAAGLLRRIHGKILELEERPDLDLALTEWRLLEPGHRFFLRLGLNDPEPGNQLLGFREGTVDHLELPVRVAHARSLGARLQPLAREHHPMFQELVVVRAHLGQIGRAHV